jgi:hypothetical protein
MKLSHRPRALAAVAVAALAVVTLAACAEKQPDRLALDPSGPFKFDKKGQTEEVKIMAFTGKQPFVAPVPVTYASSDTTVATVDDKGVITCTGSGKATITASAWSLTTTAEVSATVVGSIEVKQDAPKPMKLNSKGHQLTVVVKDDKGNVIEKPKVMYRATDYCVEVSDDGFLKPLTDGECDVVVSAADQSARIKLEVRE